MALICPDIDALRDAYSQPHNRGIRINTLKMPLSRAGELPFALESVPFSPLGFRVTDDDVRLGLSPWHHAGAYYVQEPSAMSAVTALDPQPGEHILDMCAAPGGKSTQIAALLGGEGLLWSNEYVRSRTQALISNIERMGIRNAVVSSLHPDKLAESMEGYFDRVLVDAPCSGEGMFRRDDVAISEWSPAHVETCAVRQAAILASAALCVRPGGVLVYSTCTFSVEENERVIAQFLDAHPDFRLEPIAADFGRAGLDICSGHDTTMCRRIYPMDGGEGHFVARLRRDGDDAPCRIAHDDASCDNRAAAELLDTIFTTSPEGSIRTIGENVYLMPPQMPDCSGVHILRAGVLLGQMRKGRIEPAHALFACAKAEDCRNAIHLSPDSAELSAFLRGEQIDAPDDMRGYTAVTCGGIVTGFGKCSGGVLKNHYPKG
ncbi:MAG: RsmB/NOP family class I SAM-dependent RNA methyltransferase, partial [Clostridia bacterium]|nr:RsmB/NOP family class I SAM-dependent RNA methyltransferase [Clostridia bacterium]